MTRTRLSFVDAVFASTMDRTRLSLVIGAMFMASAAPAGAQPRRPFPRRQPPPTTPPEEKKEEPKPEEPPEPDTWTAIVGGDVITVSGGTIREGTVLIHGRKIAKVGHGVDVPKEATVIDAKGKVVAPGFVVATARGIGVSGFGGPPAPNAKLADSLDPFAQSIELALSGGITTCMILPGGGGGFFGGSQRPRGGQPFDGTSAVLKLTFGELSSMVLRDPAAVIVNYRSESPSNKFAVREALDKAKKYVDKVKEYEDAKKAGKTDAKEPPKDPQTELLAKALRREIPLRIAAWDQDDLVAAAELSRDYKVKVILDQAVESWAVSDSLASADVALVLTPRLKVRPDREKGNPSGSRFDTPAIVAKAGVPFAIVPYTANVNTQGIFGRDLMNLPFEAAFGMRGGLTEDQALASITLGAARTLGIDDRVGSIEEGKDADLIVLDGHPLDYRTFVELTLVNGKVAYDKEKSTLFRGIKAAR
ncbi:MAG: amidohydrolase family protein [Planctomycetes bacterium]|nr:amidohydrolase family protein [Planctomycetota bacterium]